METKSSHMLLAGDIGGTKTLLGLFDPGPPRPRPIAVRTFATLDYDGLPTMIADFLAKADGNHVSSDAITSACFGAAGPVIGGSAALTNVPWRVDGHLVADRFGFRRVLVINDLQAMAFGVPQLTPSELHPLQHGQAPDGGNIALIAAGTGLGEALIHNIDGRLIPSPSEGGHADFAARTEREIALLRDLTERYGRADVEHVVSGHGLVNIHRMTHRSGSSGCAAGIDLEGADAPAAISTAALEHRCDCCVETLDLFIEAYGSEAGNLALRSVATGGVFVGGGIAPKILPAISNGAFIRAFRGKPPLEALLSSMPVHVILNAQVGLLGAAAYAASS